MADLVLDIETVVDPDLPPPPSKDGEKDTFPAPPHWQVVTIGVAWVSGRSLRKLTTIQGTDERAKLVGFLSAFADQRAPRIVGWNTRGFDVPVIAHRSMRHGLTWPWYYQASRGCDPRYRYSDSAQLDLKDWLSDHGSARVVSLDIAAKSIGLPGKLDTSGGDVAAMYAAGEHEAIDRYCLQDVAQTTALALRFDLLRGHMSIEEYGEAMRQWEAVVRDTPGARDLLEHVNLQRLYLPQPSF